MIFKNMLLKIIRFIRLLSATDKFYQLHHGMNLIIGSNSLIYPSKFITIGNNTFIGRNVTISTSQSGRSPISIGNNVLIAERVQIIGGNHALDRADIPINQQGEGKQGAIIIEDDVWIGASSIILTGITIGKGSVIAAGSVVTKNVEPYSVVAGNPARFIKSRL